MYEPVVLSKNGNRRKGVSQAISYLFLVTFLAAMLWITCLRFLNGSTRVGKMTPDDFQKPEFRHKPEHFHPCNSDDNKGHNSYNVDDDFGDWDNYVVYIFYCPKSIFWWFNSSLLMEYQLLHLNDWLKLPN